MRRASRDYSKYLRGSEELGGGNAHDSAPPPPAPPQAAPPLAAHPHPPPASRSLLAALVLLGLGQVVCSVALFLYFRAQVSGCRGGEGPPRCLGCGRKGEQASWEPPVALRVFNSGAARQLCQNI